MEHEEEYLETDVRRIILDNLKHLRVEAEFVEPTILNGKKPRYYSGFFSGTVLDPANSIALLKVKGRNFDYIQIVRRG